MNLNMIFKQDNRGSRGRYRMVVGFTTTFAINTYHHYPTCEFESYVIKFNSDFQQVGGFLRLFRFPPPIKLTATI
jgi:hypothetical protein